MSQAYTPLKVIKHQESLDDLRDFQQPVPPHVQLIISDLCNQDCSFCAYRMTGFTSNQLFSVGPLAANGTNNPKRMIPVEKCFEILDDCAAMGVKAIQFTGGGEPTVHPQHISIMNHALELGLEIALVSNGLNWKDSLYPILLQAKWVRISIDAGSPETYAKVRRVNPKQFDRVSANIKKLTEMRATLRKSGEAEGVVPDDQQIGIGFVVTEDNWSEVIVAATLAQSWGVDNLRISAVFQQYGSKYFDDFYDRAKELCCTAENMSDDTFTVHNMFGDRIDDLQQQSPDYSFCGYQHFCTYIGGDLNVYRCCNTAYNERGLLGSIADRGFRDFWYSKEKWDAMATFDAHGCERCQFNNKNRAIAYALDPNPTHKNFV